MSRVTAPVSKLARSINTVSSHQASHGAVLSPKYAELLKSKTTDTEDPVQSTGPESFSTARMPLLPDSFSKRHEALDTPDAPLAKPEIRVVAAVPSNVSPASPLTKVEGMGVDGVELRFAHDRQGKKDDGRTLKI